MFSIIATNPAFMMWEVRSNSDCPLDSRWKPTPCISVLATPTVFLPSTAVLSPPEMRSGNVPTCGNFRCSESIISVPATLPGGHSWEPDLRSGQVHCTLTQLIFPPPRSRYFAEIPDLTFKPGPRLRPAFSFDGDQSPCCHKLATRTGATPIRASVKTKPRCFWG